jgi:hypothetical protein
MEIKSDGLKYGRYPVTPNTKPLLGDFLLHRHPHGILFHLQVSKKSLRIKLTFSTFTHLMYQLFTLNCDRISKFYWNQ